MQAGYGLEQLTSAVFTIAESRETLQQRLISACFYDILNINAERDLPPEMRGKFDALCQLLNCTPGTAEPGSIQETVSAMNDDEARRHIDTIAQLYRELSEYLALRT
ncbi:MAG: hypothetical protein KKF77_08705 [Proteobacteria bacterium]|nr:hypothetical protein [Pseudomonadota bacterium]